jgi:hypothetical protein
MTNPRADAVRGGSDNIDAGQARRSDATATPPVPEQLRRRRAASSRYQPLPDGRQDHPFSPLSSDPSVSKAGSSAMTALDLDAVRAALGGYQGASGRLSICSDLDYGGRRFATDVDGLDFAVQFVRDQDVQGAGSIYHRGTTVREDAVIPPRKRGKAEHSGLWLRFQADLDYGKAGYAPDAETVLRVVKGAELPKASAFISSGHGVYPQWELDPGEPDSPEVRALAADVAAELRRAFAAEGFALDQSIGADAARVWRIPGTVNRKPGMEPVACRVIERTAAAYRFSDLRAAVPRQTQTGPDQPATGTWEDRAPFTLAQARAFTAEPMGRLRAAQQGDRNNALNAAAMALGHFVPPGFWSYEDTEEALIEVCEVIGYAREDPGKMHRTITSGLAAGMAQPARRTEGDEGTANPGAPPTADEIYARKVAVRVEQLAIDEQARQILVDRKRAGRPSIADGLIDSCDLDQIPPPRMLLGEFIPHAAVGVLAGKWGAYKSFLATSWACSLAVGRPWQNRPEFAVPEAVRVLYVAAEGAAGISQRIAAWKSAYGPIPRGYLVVYPKPIKLTSEPDVAELAQIVGDQGFGVVIVDTLHRSALGSEENSATEFGLIFEAMAGIRDEYGTTTLFADHTGHGGGRPRGTSAKEDDSDFVLIADFDGEDRGPATQRTVKIRKRKDLPSEGEWPIRLVPVPEVESAYVEIGTVSPGSTASPSDLTEQWHSRASSEVPGEIENLRGKGTAAARDIFRLLRYVGGSRGLTPAEIRSALNESPRTHHRSTIHAGLTVLDEAGVTVEGSTPARLILAPRFEVP